MESGQPSFYWYDLETSGIHPASDRIIQFAGMRTDLELNPLGESTSWFVRIGEEVVPSPAACLVTGITPQQTAEQGIGEWEAITEINRLFATPGTCTVGFNNLRFDDEFVRYTLYRNLMDPYAREWRDGNSRWDLIDLVRAAGALRPDGIDWPVIDGRPSFRLEAMTQANGLDHESAHDALSDVQATLSVARLIRRAQPRLWDYFRQMSGKAEIRRMLVPLGANLCVHVSRMYSNARFCLAPVISVAQHPEIDNSVIVADLSVDVSNLIERSVDELREMLFTSESEERPALKAVRFNRCPFVGPIKVVRQQDATRLQLDLDQVHERWQQLKAHPDLDRKIAEVYRREQPREQPADVEEALYGGFLSDADRARCDALHRTLAANGPWPDDLQLRDRRLEVLSARLKARVRSAGLSIEETGQWRAYVSSRLSEEHSHRLTVDAFKAEVEQTMAAEVLPRDAKLLAALKAYGDELATRVLVAGDV